MSETVDQMPHPLTPASWGDFIGAEGEITLGKVLCSGGSTYITANRPEDGMKFVTVINLGTGEVSTNVINANGVIIDTTQQVARPALVPAPV